MYIQVRLLSGYKNLLWYKVPSQWSRNSLYTSLVQVPVKGKVMPAFVVKVYDQYPYKMTFAIREIESIEPFPGDGKFNYFIKSLAYLYQVDEIYFWQRLRAFLGEKKKNKGNHIISSFNQQKFFQKTDLTDEQQKIYYACKSIKTYKPAVIHGVTGSGKTHVYLACIQNILYENKTVVFLVPDVSLARYFEHLFRNCFPTGTIIHGFYSGKTVREKNGLWKDLATKKAMIIVGVHLPILLPLPHLGLIIVDEEHDGNYQEKKHPAVHTREAALMRAKQYNIPIILGSATPSLQTLFKVKKERWKFFQLTKRFSGSFPDIQLVDLTKKDRRKYFWISKELEAAIHKCLLKREQAIVFLNRRGHSLFIQCTDCGFIFDCKNCSVSLTLHSNQSLQCHYCSYEIFEPVQCASCNKGEKNLLKRGMGTQQLMTVLQELFPTAKIARLDADITRKKNEWERAVDQFKTGELDVLVGTKTITKGFHFPGVTLIGIVWADAQLNFTRFNAGESALAELLQVAGRAGRETEESLVIVQTMAKHKLFDYLHEVRYLQYYKKEMETRKLLSYPPVCSLGEITMKHYDEIVLKKEVDNFAAQLRKLADKEERNEVVILGPTQAAVYKVKKEYTWKLYVKGEKIKDIIGLYKEIREKNEYKISIFFTPVF